jgi:hypothetical protein
MNAPMGFGLTPTRPPAKAVWWVIDSEDLLAMLREVDQGADPELVYLEHYANCSHEDVA